jgi:N-acetyl-alpha-D-glucosaminyl L-malate synthase BshA
MKIGITCHPSAGGSGVLATELGIALAERGHTVHFVTEEVPFRLKEFHENIFCHYTASASYPLFRTPHQSLSLATKICEVAEENDIELWHAHYAIPNAASAIFAREMLPKDKRFCLVATLHGTDITLVGSDPSFFRITKFSMEQSCAVTAVSEWLRQETLRKFQIEKPIQTIYNFVDTDKFRPQSSLRCHFAPQGEKVVMHISNFRPVKRVTDVVRIFRKILDHVPAKLVMVGEGPERLSATGVAKQLGVTDRILYLGNYANIEEVLPCADLILQPSEHESFGLVPLEAMACQVPVVATASGGITEVVSNGKTGYLCEVGDIESMAAGAIDILTDEAKARAMGENGRAVAIAKFHRDIIVSQYEALYKELLARRSKATMPA